MHLAGFIKKKKEDIYLQGLIESKLVQNIRNHYATEEWGKHKSHSYIYCVNADAEKKISVQESFN